MDPNRQADINRENIPYARVSTYADGRDSTYPESEKNAASVCKKAGANVCAALDQGLRYHLHSTIVTIVTIALIKINNYYYYSLSSRDEEAPLGQRGREYERPWL